PTPTTWYSAPARAFNNLRHRDASCGIETTTGVEEIVIVNLSRATSGAACASVCRRVVVGTLLGAVLAAFGGNKDDETTVDPASLPASRSEAAMFLSKA